MALLGHVAQGAVAAQRALDLLGVQGFDTFQALGGLALERTDPLTVGGLGRGGKRLQVDPLDIDPEAGGQLGLVEAAGVKARRVFADEADPAGQVRCRPGLGRTRRRAFSSI
ncbi:MAG TPA: hypothetical protein EYP07_14975 [Kiloniellaceae bacterium]|nr:hypothetical protein [Kiloniellaceae bacterium]